MNCPKCNHQQKRGQAGMTCQSCGYAFVFDPKKDRLQGLPLTDGLMQSILSAASAGQNLVYTRNQLYVFACIWYCNRNKFSPILAVIIIVFSLLVGVSSGWYVISLLGILVVPLLYTANRRKRLQRTVWDACLKRWEDAGQPLTHLVPHNALQAPPPDWEEPDIYDYGALGLILCQHNDIVDWLVLNKLPADLKLVVLSEHGYPAYLTPIVTRLLQDHPDLPIYLLHHGSPTGTQMAERLQTASPVPLDDHPIFTLGIASDDVDRLPSRHVLPSTDSRAQQALDSIPYKELVTLMAEAISSTPPKSLAGVWLLRRTQPSGRILTVLDDGDFG